MHRTVVITAIYIIFCSMLHIMFCFIVSEMWVSLSDIIFCNVLAIWR